jgi:DNA-binding CsgD family transcriptional regulator/tetratricopeptide (TPR) repeat protein
MAPSSPIPDFGDHGEDSLYRPTFVGRRTELQQLCLAFDAAVQGRGGQIMLVGEPGIGKTALWRELAEYAAASGGRVLVGHCYDEGTQSIPYQPFVETLQASVDSYEPDALRLDLGAGASDVGRIMPGVLDRLQIVQRPRGSPEEDRWRLLQAVGGFLLSSAKRQPLLLVLEDLHDADRASLDQLVHLSRHLSTSHLLVLGTYRDLEVDRMHPLSSVLAELRRSEHFRRMALRGLTVDEVRELCEVTTGEHVGWARAERVHRRTEGIPLFVQEVLRNAVELDRASPRPSHTGSALEALTDDDMPEGLRDVVGKRLNRLSETTNRVLATAAVVGHEFRLDVLQRVTEINDDDLLEALEQAQKYAIVEELGLSGGSLLFRFCHAFFRQALYEEIFAARRVRLHQRVARMLEEAHADHLDRHASELADHFARSPDPADLAKSILYGEMAARYAMSVFAYSEAEYHLRRALNAQEIADPDAIEKRCDLLLALGETMLPQEQPRRVTETVAAEAFRLAESHGDSPRAARAAMQALEPFIRVVAVTRLLTIADFPEWAARLDRHASEGTVERVFADIWLGCYLLNTGQVGPGSARIRKGLSRAEDLDEEQAHLAAVQFALPFLQSVQDVELVDRQVRLLKARPRSARFAGIASRGLANIGERLLAMGDRTAAEQEWQELQQLAEHTRDATVALRVREVEAARAYLDGDLDTAVATVDAAAKEVGAFGGYQIPQVYEIAIRALFERGQLAEERLAPLELGARQVQALRAMTLALLGHCDEAQEVRAQFGQVGSVDDDTAVFNMTCLLEVSTRCNDRGTAAVLVTKLAPLAGRLSRSVSFGRLLGRTAAMLGQFDDASDYYGQALAVCTKVRFRPELALLHLQLAELIVEHHPGRRTEAMEHLDAAIPELTSMQMQPRLERADELARAIGLRETLPAAASKLTPELSTRASEPGNLGRLTTREREVVGLLAKGLTNREIAEQLIITETTAEVHVKHILSKLGFKSRSQVAVWASRTR